MPGSPFRLVVAAAALASAVLAASVARADTLVLTNGRRVDGTIVREDEKVVVLRVARTGNLTFARNAIREIVKLTEAPPAEEPAPAPETPPTPRAPAPSEKAPRATPPRSSTPPVDPLAIVSLHGAWKVPDGPLADVVENLARQAGLGFRATPMAAAALRQSKPNATAYESQRDLGATLARLLDFASAGSLGCRVEERILVVGLPHEVSGAIPVRNGAVLSWEDAVGDVTYAFDPGRKRPDLRKLTVDSKQGYVHFHLWFTEDIDATLRRTTQKGTTNGYELVEIFVDADGDPATGKAVSWDERNVGWEHSIDVASGIDARDSRGNRFSQWGNIETIAGEHTVNGTFVTYSACPMASSGGVSVTTGDKKDDPRKLTTVSGDEIDVAVPYSILGVKRGDTIRLTFCDSLEEMFSKHRFAIAGTVVLD